MQGIDASYLIKAQRHELLVDFARITGSLPSSSLGHGLTAIAVRIALNATALHPTRRQPVLTLGGSPWISVKDPRNTSGDAAEVARWRALFEKQRDELAAANKAANASVKIGAAIFDSESMGWSASWVGVPGKQESLLRLLH